MATLSGLLGVNFRGDSGYSGFQGDKGGVRYTFSSTTTTSNMTTATGELRFNNATIDSVTSIYITNDDINAISTAGWIGGFDDSTNTVKGQLIITNNSNSSNVRSIFDISAVTVGGSGYYILDVVYVSGNIPQNGDALSVNFSRTGDSGYSGYSGIGVGQLNYWEQIPQGSTTFNLYSNSQYFFPVQFYAQLNAHEAKNFASFVNTTSRIDCTHTASTRTARWDFSIGIYGGIYTQGTGTQVSSIYSQKTFSNQFVLQSSVSGNAGVNSLSISVRLTYPGADGADATTSTSYTTSATRFTLQTSQMSNFFGLMATPLPVNSTFTAGEYFVNIFATTSSSFTADTTSRWVGSAAQAVDMGNVFGTQINQNFKAMAAAAAPAYAFVPGLGSFTTAATGFASPVGFTAISSSTSNPRPYYQLLNTNYTFL